MTFPVWEADPAVSFYGELDEIALTDGDTGEVPAPIYKTAGIVLLSNELRDDSSPAVADLAGAGLANKIGRAVDGAYWGNTTAKGPNGLPSIAYTAVGHRCRPDQPGPVREGALRRHRCRLGADELDRLPGDRRGCLAS